jgi:hypothetical protein
LSPFQTDFAGILMSIACLAFVKFSIVSFFRRIFRGKVFGRITLVLLIVNAAWGVAFVLAVLLQCVPVSGAWDKVTREHAVCYNPVPTFYGVAISDTILDVVILVLPQPFTWRLHMPMRQKLAVSGIFLVGIL